MKLTQRRQKTYLGIGRRHAAVMQPRQDSEEIGRACEARVMAWMGSLDQLTSLRRLRPGTMPDDETAAAVAEQAADEAQAADTPDPVPN